MSIDGLYEIVEMELWDKDAIDLVEPAYISIQGKSGKLHFICVDGEMDIQKGKDRYLFTWYGMTNVILQVDMGILHVLAILILAEYTNMTVMIARLLR